MKKLETLKKNYEFKNVLAKGKFYCGKYLTIYIKENKFHRNIIGIAINTKMGKAVSRNHVKRLIRENYRLIKDNLLLGNNIVFLWNKNIDIKNADFYEIKSDMNNIFNKAKLFRN